MNEALDVSLRLARAQAALVKRFDVRLAAHGVSLADFLMLLHLGRAKGGRMRRIELAEAVGLSPSGVTRGLAPLERIGLVVREANPRDARVAYAALTDVGRELLEEMVATAERAAEELFATPPWTKDEVGELAGLLGRLGGTGLPEDHAGAT